MYVLKVTCGVIRLGDVALVLVPALSRLHDLVRIEEVRVHLRESVRVRGHDLVEWSVFVCVRDMTTCTGACLGAEALR